MIWQGRLIHSYQILLKQNQYDTIYYSFTAHIVDVAGNRADLVMLCWLRLAKV